MITKETIQKNLWNCLEDTSFLNVPGFRRDKVRDTYDRGDTLILITTDRQSAFDRILANIPFKGQVLNRLSAFWFENTSDIISNHVIHIPDPNVTIGKKCKVIPVEFVMRAYLTGSTATSVWVQYSQGIRDICGHILPDGMKRNQKLEQPILTPAKKSAEHDESITAAQIVDEGLIDKGTWEYLHKIAFSLFARGTEIADRNGLILVDTKYEFGIDDKGEILLIDEIHTPDSSRYWMKETYESRLAEGKEPENIDKEFLRLWFREHCDPYEDKILPTAPDDLVIELSYRYIRLFEMLTGKEFADDGTHPVKERLKKNLHAYLS
ncbi:phosphoribosylaminoimidazolesuccinocarboxamide synthase [Paenibacillus lycopersici]|uniref:Phosphoribosylaminoimidazole-succinocarboxamide synthase n=1 Tax=Paenibacillus lycopersici TaxID=2704462 RepID=A0A6C0G6I6_9BACL|nr:phosphoribosylaminoimidazolesuccinocarboxamide synthase [Paenibacillus lycopersici]QHT61225.1 phosphoribosylaminoimidazolesuccinocarboxamide synthase [Paenibacillus lycopersici]